MVGLLHLAATQDCEAALAQVVLEEIAHGKKLSLSRLKQRYGLAQAPVPKVVVNQHSLAMYDRLLTAQAVTEESHV
jgi:hypothetical protein